MTIIVKGISEYGMAVKKRLVEINKPQKWLESEITARTGMYCDSSLLNKVFTDKVKSYRIVTAINEILEIGA